MILINVALSTIAAQSFCLLLVPAILYMTRDSQTLDGLMMLGPLLISLALIPVVIVLSLIALTRPEVKKSLWAQIVLWVALVLNVGFTLYGYIT